MLYKKSNETNSSFAFQMHEHFEQVAFAYLLVYLGGAKKIEKGKPNVSAKYSRAAA